MEKDAEEDEADERENEIEELQLKIKILKEKGEKIRDAIIEQTKLLLSEESLLSQLRTQIMLRQLKQRQRQKKPKKKIRLPSRGLTKKQEEFLQDVRGLERLLEDLQRTDSVVVQELQQGKQINIRVRMPGQETRSGKDSILDHPTISGLDNPFPAELEEYEDLPVIVVEEEYSDYSDQGDGEVVIRDYEVEVEPPVPAVAAPPPPPPPAAHVHGHVLQPHHAPHHPPHPAPQYRHHHHHRQYYQTPQYYTEYQPVPHPPPPPPPPPPTKYYEEYSPAPHPPPEYYPEYSSLPVPPPHDYSHPPVPPPHEYYHPHPRPLLHQPGPPPPPPPEPHITLTGELLRGFQHLGGGVH